jgi:hypothetical protein
MAHLSLEILYFDGQGQMWKAVMENHLRGFHGYSEPEFYKTVFKVASQSQISSAAKQVTHSGFISLVPLKQYL